MSEQDSFDSDPQPINWEGFEPQTLPYSDAYINRWIPPEEDSIAQTPDAEEVQRRRWQRKNEGESLLRYMSEVKRQKGQLHRTHPPRNLCEYLHQAYAPEETDHRWDYL